MFELLLTLGTGVTLAGILVVAALIRSRQLHRWLGGYVRRAMRGRPRTLPGPIHLFVCIVDHFEPLWGGASAAVQRARVSEWINRYPQLALRHRDSRGRPLQHTFFYPAEEYVAEHLDRLAQLRQQGVGDVEVHLHHDNDSSDNLRVTLTEFARLLHERHGLLRVDQRTDRLAYGFIHGNWALDNSRSDGKWCGVNDELVVLRETGCYADFTFPSAPSETQPATVNTIYYATDDPLFPRSYNTGQPVRVGGRQVGDLLIVQGPLSLDWRSRKWGLLPRIENGDLSHSCLPSPARVDAWVRQHIHVEGQPNWVFVKLHTHGAQEKNFEPLLGRPIDAMLNYLEERYNDGETYRLHYVTAWEMYLMIKAAEGGSSDPDSITLNG